MARTNKKGGNSAGLKGWSAFTNAEKNLDNTSRSDGRAGSSAYQIAGKLEAGKAGPKTERQTSMDRERKLNKMGSQLPQKDPVRRKMFAEADKVSDERYRRAKAGDPMKIANQYRQHKVSKSDRADAIARSRMIDRKYADKSPRERATLAASSQYKSYGAKDEFKRMKDKGMFTSALTGGNRKKAQK
jgi:hypothetical protein